jgi:hypothetical protein
MLPSDLLIHRFTGEELTPKRLVIDAANQAIAAELIEVFRTAQGHPRRDLNRQLQDLEGEETDYRIKRGLAHLLMADAFSTFETVSPLDPGELRQRVFALAAQRAPSQPATQTTLEHLAITLTQELGREVLPVHIQTGLYAD